MKEKVIIIFVPGIFGSRLKTMENKILYPPSLKHHILYKMGVYKKNYTNVDFKEILLNPFEYINVDTLESYGTKSVYKFFFTKINNEIIKKNNANKFIVFNYDWRMDLLVVVERLRNQITFIQQSKKYSNHKMILIGHSLGGLLCRLVLEYCNTTATTACFFCATPFFGNDYYLNILLTISTQINIYRNTQNKTIDETFWTNIILLFKQYRFIMNDTFFTPDQMLQLLWTFRKNFILCCKYIYLNAIGTEALSKLLDIDIDYLNRIMSISRQLAIVETKNTYYYLVYNAQFENTLNKGDGIIEYSSDELIKLTHCQRMIQIRDNDARTKHAFFFNSLFVQTTISEEIKKLLNYIR